MSEMMQVPDGWEVKPLNTYTQLITKGSTPTTYGFIFKDNGINFIKAESIDKFGNIDVSEIQFIDEETHHFLKRSQLKQGDLLFSIAGVLGRITILKKEDLPANTNQALAIIRLKEYSGKYLYYFLQSHFILSQIQSLNVQMAQANLSLENLNNFQIIIPKEKKEQEKIAKILSTLDKEIESTNRLIEKEKNIKTALMQELLTNGIDQNGQIRSPQTHTYKPSELGFIPDEWEIRKIEEVADVYGGGTPDRSNNDFWENGTVYWATPTDITAIRNSNYVEDTKEKITEKGLSGSSAKLLPAGSILLTSRATIGERKISKIPVCTNQGFTSLVPKNDNGIFIYYLLDRYIAYMYSRAYGTTFPEISRTEVKNMPIALPKDKAEQKQIAKILTTQDKKIETEETNLAKLKELKKGVINDLLSGKVRVKIV